MTASARMTASASMAAVRIRALTKRYGRVDVVRGIDIDVPAGRITCLLGPSGCGKTTTLRMVAGLESPDGGEIAIGDEVVAGPGHSVPPERRRLGMVFQSYAVWPHLDVQANVEYPLRVAGAPAAERRTRVEGALALVGLSALASRSPSQLSGGQQQRVALARALVAQPRVLLLDEPLSNLDARLREDLRAEIAGLQARTGVTVLYVTHDQEEALALAHQVVVMREGGIEQAGSPSDLYDRPRTRFVASFVGSGVIVPGALVGSSAPEVLLRPEQVSLAPEGQGSPAPEGTLSATVTAVAYRGDRTLLHLRHGELELLAYAPGALRPAIGETVRVRVQGHTAIGDDR